MIYLIRLFSEAHDEPLVSTTEAQRPEELFISISEVDGRASLIDLVLAQFTARRTDLMMCTRYFNRGLKKSPFLSVTVTPVVPNKQEFCQRV